MTSARFRLAYLVGLAGLASVTAGCAGSFQLRSSVGGDEGPVRECVSPVAPFRVSTLDWDRESRRRFEEDSRRRAVVVRAEHCGWKVLPACHAKSALAYAYRPLSLARDRQESGNTSGVGLSGAAGSPAGVNRSEGAVRDIAVAGRFELAQIPSSADLDGECDGATHVVAAYSAGAFQIDDGSARRARIDVPYAGHAHQEDWRSESRQEGRVDACGSAAGSAGSTGSAGSPPVDCSAAIELQLVPLAFGVPTTAVATSSAPASAPPASNTRPSCAAGDLSACDLECRNGVSTSCSSLVQACIGGAVGACVSASTNSLNHWMLAGQ